MDRRIKIVLIVAIFLAIVSGIFLLFGRRQPTKVAAPKTVNASAKVKSLTPVSAPVAAPAAKTPSGLPSATPGAKMPTTTTPGSSTAPGATPAPVSAQDRKTLMRNQWTTCKDKTIAAGTSLLWSVQITEAIPPKGTYAKGNLDNDTAFPVHVIIKASSTIKDKINAMLVVGKNALLRGTCTSVATDGSVVLEAF
jgi:hypothetical protein